MFANQFSSSLPHRCRQLWALIQETQRRSQLFDIPRSIQQSGLSMVHELRARTEIGDNDCAALSIGFENCLAQGLVYVRGQNGETRPGDQPIQFPARHVVDEFHILQFVPARQIFPVKAPRTFSRDLQPEAGKYRIARSRSATPFSADRRPKYRTGASAPGGGGAGSGTLWKCGSTSMTSPAQPFSMNLLRTNWLGARNRFTQLSSAAFIFPFRKGRRFSFSSSFERDLVVNAFRSGCSRLVLLRHVPVSRSLPVHSGRAPRPDLGHRPTDQLLN